MITFTELGFLGGRILLGNALLLGEFASLEAGLISYTDVFIIGELCLLIIKRKAKTSKGHFKLKILFILLSMDFLLFCPASRSLQSREQDGR